MIEQAEERTREAQNALAGAESDARIARDSAKQAQEHAEQASKVNLQLFKFLFCEINAHFFLLGRRNNPPRSIGNSRQSRAT